MCSTTSTKPLKLIPVDSLFVKEVNSFTMHLTKATPSGESKELSEGIFSPIGEALVGTAP
jgi:hypothetical protein